MSMCFHNWYVWEVHYTNKSMPIQVTATVTCTSRSLTPLRESLLLFDWPKCHQLRWPSISNHTHIWCAGMVDPRHDLEQGGGGPVDTCAPLLSWFLSSSNFQIFVTKLRLEIDCFIRSILNAVHIFIGELTFRNPCLWIGTNWTSRWSQKIKWSW